MTHRTRTAAMAAGLALLATACYLPYDLDATKGADISWLVVEPTGVDDEERFRWYVAGTAEPILDVTGSGGGNPIPGDYDGDGRWEAALSMLPGVVSAGGVPSISFLPVLPSDGPAEPCAGPSIAEVPGSWDADKATEPGWYLHGWAEWQIQGQAPVRFGRPATTAACDAGTADVPVPADYDGDGRTDIAVYQPDTGDWLVHGHPGVFANLGVGPGLPAPADYDGDGDDDPALLTQRTATLHIAGGGTVTFPTSDPSSTFLPVPADYDGDGTDDPAVAEKPPNTPYRWRIDGQPPVDLPAGAQPTVARPWLVMSLIPLTYAERCPAHPVCEA